MTITASQADSPVPAVEARQLSFSYHPDLAPVISGFDCRFAPGLVTAVSGASGCGKSTLLYLLAGLLRPSAGAVLIAGQPFSRLRDGDRAARRAACMGFVFQDAMLDQSRDLIDNVCESAAFSGLDRRPARRRAMSLLTSFGVAHRVDHRPGEISGGQAQRVALCRALLTDPAVILADEPTGNLDVESAEVVWSALRECAANGSCVIVATHSPRLVDEADHAIMLPISSNPRLEEAGGRPSIAAGRADLVAESARMTSPTRRSADSPPHDPKRRLDAQFGPTMPAQMAASSTHDPSGDPTVHPTATARHTRARPLGHPMPAALFREAVGTAMARPTAGIVVAVVTAVVCVTVLLTTGRAIRTERDVVSRLDHMGTMLIAASDNRGSAGIKASSVTTLNTLTGVDWAFGLGEAFDGHNSALPADGTGVATRRFHGDLRTVVTLTSGRWPRPGEAIASVAGADALGLLEGIGGITVPDLAFRSYPIVGSYRCDPALRTLTNTILVIPEPDAPLDQPVLYLYAKATQAQMVDAVVAAIPGILTATSASVVTVESPQALREVREHIGQDLAANSRSVMLATTATGLILVTITMLAAVSDRKNDIGRRRALGASRSAIIVMVITQAALAAMIGAATGVVTGWVITVASQAAPATPRFTLGLTVLSTLSATLAAAPPAVLAAVRDPVRILRVP